MRMLPKLTLQILRNILIWLGVPTLLIAAGQGWLVNFVPQSQVLHSRWIGDGIMLIGFIIGARAQLMILQFGEPDGYIRLNPNRLIQIGVFARNRHPLWWGLQIWIMGALLTASLPWVVIIILWGLSFLGGSAYLLFIEERNLTLKFAERYENYRKSVPFLGIKINAPEAKEPGWVYQCASVLGHFLFRWRYKITVEGLEHIPQYENFIIVAPHACYLDPFLFGIFVPVPVHFVTTADAYTNPIKQWFMHRLYTFPIRRHIQDLAALRKIIKLTGEGKVVGIFPEGERSMDGRPGEIVPETVRVLQRCKVPLLPVEIRGAFEIWPRWSNVMRKGRIHIRFNPVIPVDAQADREQLTAKIRQTIFPGKMNYQSVRSENMTKGIEKLLWGCIECGTPDQIIETGPQTVRCQECKRVWILDSNYHLRTSEGGRISLIEWMDRLKTQVKPMPIPESFSFQNGEIPYLRSELTAYLGPDQAAPQYQNSELILTDQAFIIYENGSEVRRWRHPQITVLTVDTKTDFSLGISGKRHVFRLPPPEHPLKWHNFFKVIAQ